MAYVLNGGNGEGNSFTAAIANFAALRITIRTAAVEQQVMEMRMSKTLRSLKQLLQQHLLYVRQHLMFS